MRYKYICPAIALLIGTIATLLGVVVGGILDHITSEDKKDCQ